MKYKSLYLNLKDDENNWLKREQELVDEIHDQDIDILKLRAKIEQIELKQYIYTEQIGWLRSVIEKLLTGESQDITALKSEMEQMKHLLSDILHDERMPEDENSQG